MSSIAIIINPISGGVRPAEARARAELASAIVDRHGDPAEVFVTERAGHARDLTRAAVARGSRLVMAWGGDGTINEVASALAFGEIPLGIVPAGSGNGLARQLGVKRQPADAIRLAIAAEPRRIDLGELGDRLFVNAAGVGFDAQRRLALQRAKRPSRSDDLRVDYRKSPENVRTAGVYDYNLGGERPTAGHSGDCRQFSASSATAPASRRVPAWTTDCSIWW